MSKISKMVLTLSLAFALANPAKTLAAPGASNTAQTETGTFASDSLTVQAVQNLNLDPYGRIVDVTFSQNLDLTAPWDRFRFDIDIVQPLAHDSGAFLGDLNDDGVLDLMLTDWDGHRLFFAGKAGSPRLFGDGIMLKETQSDASSDPYAGGGAFWIGGDIGDIDNDGENEIVIGSDIYKNVGTLTEPKLDYQYTFSGVGSGWDPATSLGDLDGDGKLDAVVSTNYVSGGNFICWNNSAPGAISFSGCTKLSMASEKTKAIGDLNGDGLLDLADEDGIYFNQGTTVNPDFIATPWTWNESGGPAWDGQYDMSMNISLKDGNGDGLLDAYLSKVGDTVWQVLYYENVGTVSSPQFQYVGPIVVNSTPMNFTNRQYDNSGTMGLPREAHLTTEDIDSNGVLDILLSNSSSSILWGFPASVGNHDVYSYQDLYTYPPKARIDPYCGVGYWGVKDFLCYPPSIFGAWTDINDDGLSDAIHIGLVYNEDMSYYYGLYGNVRTGTWPFTLSTATPFQSVPSGNQASGMAIAVTDVNLDGYPDLVVGQEDGTLLYYGNIAGSFADPIPLSDSLGSPIDVGDQASPAAIDLNGDGNIDFLVANSDGKIHKVLNVTSGDPQGYMLGELLATVEQDPVDIVHVVGGGWLSPTLGTIDMDKDGLSDVLMGDDSGQVWLLHNIGDQNSASFSLNAFNVSRTAAAYMDKLDASHYRLYFALPTEANQTKLSFHLPLSSGEVFISEPPPPAPGAFNKTGPANGATNQSTSPTLNWGTSAGATSYKYCYDTTNDNTCSSWTDNGAVTSVTLSGLDTSTTYYWHVQAINAGGSTYANGSSTVFWSFRTIPNPPGAFNKTGPVNGATNQSTSPTLGWTASAGATSYEYCYDTSDDDACSNWTSNGTSTGKVLSGLNPETTYYWHVRAVNVAGTLYSDNAENALWSFTTGINPPGPFNKSAPANGATGQLTTPTLSWSSSVGATSYEYCYDTTHDNACSAWTSSGTSTSVGLSGLNYGTPYYWHVRAVNSGGITYPNGSATAFWKFTTQSLVIPGVPTLLLPLNGSLVTSLQPPFDWKDSKPAADHYQLQVSTNRTFTALVIDEPDIPASTFKPTSNLTPGKLHYWRVRALNVMDQPSAWSAKWTLKTPLAQPELLAPTEGESLLLDRPAFDWSDVPGATGYTLQGSAASNFSTLLVNVTVTQSQYTATKDLPQNKTLYWRVRAKSPAVTSPWSAKWTFQTGNPPTVPVLVAPLNAALVKDYTPPFNWNNSKVPTGTTFKHYEIQWDDNKEFSSPETATTTEDDITASNFTPPSDLASNTKYYWRVRSVNTVGIDDHTSGWSAIWSFRTIIPAPTGLTVTPDVLQPSFSWDAATGEISGYSIQVSTTSNFSTLILNSTTQNPFYNMTKNLPSGKIIYWRVRVKGANGPSAWSKTQFTTP